MSNSKAFANEFIKLGLNIVSGGTDNHLFVLDTYSSIGLTGKEVETLLDKINITVNKNQIPNDTLPPLKSSGVRIGTAAMTSKGWTEEQFVALADLIYAYLSVQKTNKVVNNEYIDEDKINSFKKIVARIMRGDTIEEWK